TPTRMAARAERAKPSFAEVVQQHLGEDASRRVSRAEEQDVELTAGFHLLESPLRRAARRAAACMRRLTPPNKCAGKRPVSVLAPRLDRDISETGTAQFIRIVLLIKRSCNTADPAIHAATNVVGNQTAAHDIRHGETTTGAQHAKRFAQHRILVR